MKDRNKFLMAVNFISVKIRGGGGGGGGGGGMMNYRELSLKITPAIPPLNI